MEADFWRIGEGTIQRDAAVESALKCRRANDSYESHFRSGVGMHKYLYVGTGGDP
jgi:hypothetical protein